MPIGQAPQRQCRRAPGQPEAPANSAASHGYGNGRPPEPGPATEATVVPHRSIWLWGQNPTHPRHCPRAEIGEVSPEGNKVTRFNSSFPYMWNHFSKNLKLLNLHLVSRRPAGCSAC